MKAFLLFIFLTTSVFSFSQCDTTSQITQDDSLVREFIGKLNSKSFKGEKVGDVLKKDKINKYCGHSYIQKVVGVLAGVNLSYKGFVSLRIYINQKDNKEFIRNKDNWSLEGLSNCKVYKIEVMDYRDLQ